MYTTEALRWLLAATRRAGWRGRTILELGDHKMPRTIDSGRDAAPVQWAKDFWLSKGAHHVCVDLRGRKDSALRFDLSRPITMPGWRGNFDYVLDVGVLARLTDATGGPGSRCGVYECLRNVHTWCKVGGIMAHVFPTRSGSGDCDDDPRFVFPAAFAAALARLNGYAVTRGPCRVGRAGRAGLAVALRKTDHRPFTTQADELLDAVTIG